MSSDLFGLPGYIISEKIKNQEILAEDYINLLYERINKIDVKINSFISKNYDAAIQRAKKN